jgi:DNA replication and repair protein RecF
VSFSVERVVLRNFRNYEHLEVRLGAELTVVLGQNAVGKTNLLEAIQLLTAAESFRRPSWGEVVKWGSDHGGAELEASSGTRTRNVSLVISDNKRSYAVNGKRKKAAQDISGIIPCVMFTPDDLGLVKDSAERRREALDSVGVQLSKTYGRLKAEYGKVVRQRNHVLKQESIDQDVLSVWDERLVHLGARLYTHRRGLFDRMRPRMSEVYERFSADTPLETRYVPAWEKDGIQEEGPSVTGLLESHLSSKKEEEAARRITLVGPHRDDFTFLLGDKDARTYASQGQQRSIALAFKLAEVSVVEEVSRTRPVLLLDDVMSELDESRREALADIVGQETQTVMTTTNPGYFSEELFERATVIEL